MAGELARHTVSQWLICLICVGLAAETSPAAEPASRGAASVPVLATSMECSNAGISLAVPRGMELQTSSEQYELARWVQMEGNKPAAAVTMQAFPVTEKVQASDFADAMTQEVRKNLAISHLSVIRQEKMPIAGQEGQLRVLSYVFRGAETVAGRLYFIREATVSPAAEQPVKLRLCYVLTVEMAPARQASMQPMLSDIARSVQLTPIRRPIDQPVKELDAPIKDYRLGYSISVPRFWHYGTTPNGAEVSQTDYVLGGLPMPVLRVIVSDAGNLPSAEEVAKRAIDELRNSARANDEDVKVISQKAVTMAGLDGWQIALEQRADTGDATADERAPATIVQRTIIAQGTRGSLLKVYSLRLYCQVPRMAVAEEMMEKIASGFAVLNGPTAASSPLTRPDKPIR